MMEDQTPLDADYKAIEDAYERGDLQVRYSLTVDFGQMRTNEMDIETYNDQRAAIFEVANKLQKELREHPEIKRLDQEYGVKCLVSWGG